jgi:hypothetical protein
VEKKLPEFLKPYFWSYDLDKLDKEKNYKLIITQVLNYGDELAEKWINNNYPQDVIREVVTHPTRGMWWRDKLRRWLNYFGAEIDPMFFEAAIWEINDLRTIFWRSYWEKITQKSQCG